MAEPDGGTGKPGGGSGPDVSGAVNEEALESEAVEIVQEAVSPRPPGTGIEIGFLLIILGLALGATFSTFGVQLFSDYAPVMFSALLALVVVLILILASAFIFRRPIWGRVFHRTEIEIDRIASPLAEVARRAADKDISGATGAAREVAELILARYAWLATRRWLIAAITGMIAAIAALAGSALLFQQNTLLRIQTDRLTEQNQLLVGQSEMISTQTQLAEADRNSQIGQFVIEVGGRLGDERQAWLDAGKSIEDFSIASLSAGTRGRIVAATLVARPYRYLAPDVADRRDTNSMMAQAFQSLMKRASLAGVEAVTARGKEMLETTATPATGIVKLIPAPLSPERGDLLGMLVGYSVLQTEELSFQGADFSFAEYRRDVLPGMSLNHASLSYAAFDWTRIVGSNFRGAVLDKASFQNTVIRQTDFSSLQPGEVKLPYSGGVEKNTFLILTNFSNSVVFESRFVGVAGSAVSFEGSALANVSFKDAQLAGASFRNGLLFEVDFSDASVQQVDLEGALVFDTNFLRKLAEAAAKGTFAQERWQLEQVAGAELAEHPRFEELGNFVQESELYSKPLFRIRRMAGK